MSIILVIRCTVAVSKSEGMGGGGPTSIYLRLDGADPDAGVFMSVGLEVVGVVVAIFLE